MDAMAVLGPKRSPLVPTPWADACCCCVRWGTRGSGCTYSRSGVRCASRLARCTHHTHHTHHTHTTQYPPPHAPLTLISTPTPATAAL